MHLSMPKAEQTMRLIAEWPTTTAQPAIDAFLGDIYSGLQVQTFNEADRAYANNHLVILSGMYGGLRALDSVKPYRLEMGYKVPLQDYKNMYDFWGEKIVALLTKSSIVINLSAVEYTKAVLPYAHTARIITPKFMTISPKTGLPTFVTVHAKIARGAFAHWLIKNRIDTIDRLHDFNGLGYFFSETLSTPDQPIFVCETFKGLGLSVRLT